MSLRLSLCIIHWRVDDPFVETLETAALCPHALFIEAGVCVSTLGSMFGESGLHIKHLSFREMTVNGHWIQSLHDSVSSLSMFSIKCAARPFNHQ